jgi:hypothetical protein
MRFALAWIPLLAGLLLAAPALADDDSDRGRDRGSVYEVTVTNVTKGQSFTPILVATHSPGVELFQVGEPASRQLELLAEDGNTGPLADALVDQGRRVGDVTTIDGLLEPGRTAKVRVRASRLHSRISLAAMLIPTNDTFFAVNGARLPHLGTTTLGAPGYDAGTEENDQDCANIPGPICGGEGFSEEPGPGDEGFVFIGNGFHELDPNDDRVLGPFTYDWRNPVARVTVRRVR